MMGVNWHIRQNERYGMESNKEIVRRYIDRVWSGRHLDEADDIIHPESHPPHGFDSLPSGAEGFKRMIGLFHESFPDLRRQINSLVAEGDVVVAHSTISGTHTGRGGILQFPPTGESWRMSGVTAFRIAEGRIIEEPWAVNDVASLFRQMARAAAKQAIEEIWNKRNADAIVTYYAADCVCHTSDGKEHRGHSGVRRLLSEFRSRHPEGRIVIEEQTAEADSVFTRWTLARFAIEDQTPVAGASLVRFANGLIAEEWAWEG
jgi:predicted ester cyclase